MVMIFGQGLFGQLLGRGINPVWWPYFLMCGVVVELFLLSTGHTLNSLRKLIGVGVIRGVVAYCYMYFIIAPFVWNQHYAAWYVALKLCLGVIGCTLAHGWPGGWHQPLRSPHAGARRHTRHSWFATSQPARLQYAARICNSIPVASRHTDPSANKPFAPPGCMP